MAAIVHTDEELRAAWQNCRRSTGWPATFEEAMADRVCSRQVRIEADRRTRRIAARAPAAAALATTPPVARTSSLPTPRTPAVFDRKRAASGERDDD